ncbi:MAG: site-specific recombinase [Burkholderiaceae bacterium]
MRDLPGLLGALDPGAPRVERHLWLLELLDWIRSDCKSVDAALARLGLLLDAADVQPDLARRLRAWWQALFAGLDMAVLLSDYGFSSRSAFVSELAERLRHRLLPATPETVDASELFSLVFSNTFDAQWLLALGDIDLARLSELLQPAEPTTAARPQAPDSWQETLLEAITICTSQVRATGFAPELRLRMSAEAREAAPFHAVSAAADALRVSYLRTLHPDAACHAQRCAALEAALQQLRTQLEACRAAGASVYTHLDEHGVSVSLVFRIRQLRERILRIRALMDCLFGERPAQSTCKLVAHLVQVGQDRRSLRALVGSNSSMLAAKVTERSSEAGEHYITRDRAEYVDMLRKAGGGGVLTAFTTLLKFAVMTLGLSAFWNGFWSSIVYAGSFVAIQLLHCTLATKQPAMTAPAMAAKLKDIDTLHALEGFVDEVSNLVRSQVASVVGNVGLVFPTVLLLSAVMQRVTGAPMVTSETAHYVLQSLTLFGPCLLFAAITGGVLFASSIIAGWTENWFVFNRLDSAMRYNPAFTSRLGAQRAARWATFLRNNISGLASNISLGLMLGLIPAFAGFFGLALELRHVTLSSGQLAAAAASLGWPVLREGAFWASVLAIPLIGALNLGVSFYFAFRLALLSHNTGRTERARIREAIWNRLSHRPLDFVWPRA